jgi:GMP synthase-like glutamine amidotransferase
MTEGNEVWASHDEVFTTRPEGAVGSDERAPGPSARTRFY